jgi:hypothetical protein
MESDFQLIRRWPCEKCENLQHGYRPWQAFFLTASFDDDCCDAYCAATSDGTFDCDKMRATMHIARRAATMAAFISTEPDQKVRSIEAEGTFPEYDNALWDMGAAMNQDLYYDLCRVPERCRECYAKVDSWCVACKEEK